MKHVTARLPSSHEARLKAFAASRGMSMNWALTRAVRAGLATLNGVPDAFLLDLPKPYETLVNVRMPHDLATAVARTQQARGFSRSAVLRIAVDRGLRIVAGAQASATAIEAAVRQ